MHTTFERHAARLLLPLSLSLCLPACGILDAVTDSIGDLVETGDDDSGEMGTPTMTLESVGAGTASEATQTGSVTIETSPGVQAVTVVYTVDGGNGGGTAIDPLGTTTSWNVDLSFQLATAGNSYLPTTILVCAATNCAASETESYVAYTINVDDNGYTFVEYNPDGTSDAYGSADVYPTPLVFGP